jgi:hypothetical protein
LKQSYWWTPLHYLRGLLHHRVPLLHQRGPGLTSPVHLQLVPRDKSGDDSEDRCGNKPESASRHALPQQSRPFACSRRRCLRPRFYTE